MNDFLTFAAAHGVLIERLVADGKIHYVHTDDKARGKKNGRYLFREDWGWVQNWATHLSPVIWQAAGDARLADSAELRRLRAQAARQRERDIALRHAAAAREAQAIVARCAQEPHPYLIRKGFAAQRALVDVDGRMVMPMRDLLDYDRLKSVQFIDADGAKLYLPGGQAGGAAFVIGNRHARDTVLVEGYATGLSVQAGLQAMFSEARVIVCFSAGNIVRVARLLAEYPGRRAVIADHDVPDKLGRCAGQLAAQTTGWQWAMPTEPGTDANDLHQARGIWPVTDLLRRAMA